MVWLQVVANLLIGCAYVAISSTLYVILRRIKDIPFSRMFMAFGLFIVSCGLTHFLDIVTVWYPVYWLDGAIRAVTALASVGTAMMLVPLVPKVVSLAEAAELAHRRGEELEEAFAKLAQAHDATKELERLKNELFANVSHELRTPLTLVLGPAERLLANPSLSRDQRSDLELIRRNARMLLKDVNALLDVAKLDAGQLSVEYRRTDAGKLLESSLSHFEGLAREYGLEVACELPADPLLADLDADKLERALLNVLANAFTYTPAGGKVRASVTSRDGTLRIEVADSGPGIPQEARGRVFERFARGDAPGRRGFGNTGLGLAISKDLVELQHGTIRAETAPEGGAAIVVELPVHAPRGAAVHQANTEQPAQSAEDADLAVDCVRAERSIEPSSLDGPRATVLLVEDDPDTHTFVADILSRGYRVEHAFDGEQGISMARTLRPDAIVADLNLPKQGGEELVGVLRTDASLAEMPIVILSAQADEALRSRLLRAGAQDYVVKPFSPEELLTRLGNLVALARVRIARDRAAEASALKTSFLGLVSHELRTPLTAMQLLVDRLTDTGGQLAPRQKQIVERLENAVVRLTDIVDTLLQYARIKGGQVEPDVEPFDLWNLTSGVLEDVRPEAKKKSLTVSIQASSGRVLLESDPKLVRIVIESLLSNAVKFTEHGSISVTVELTGDRRVVRIIDTGPGIAEEEQHRIFEPFSQLAQVKHKHLPGVGLGLSLVRQIVNNLNAHVRVHSEVGKGSTFEVSFPAAIGPRS